MLEYIRILIHKQRRFQGIASPAVAFPSKKKKGDKIRSMLSGPLGYIFLRFIPIIYELKILQGYNFYSRPHILFIEKGPYNCLKAIF